MPNGSFSVQLRVGPALGAAEIAVKSRHASAQVRSSCVGGTAEALVGEWLVLNIVIVVNSA